LRRLRNGRSLRDDAGLTLTELLISMMIFGLLMAMVTSIMISLTNMSKDSLARSRAVGEARLGLAQIDRQVRSGNVILNPANESMSTAGVPAFFSMRIYTQEDGVPKCAQWRVIDHDEDGYGDLEFRTWDPAYPAVIDVSSWSPVAHNMVEMATPPSSQSDINVNNPLTWPPFWVNTAASGTTKAQAVTISLRLKDPQERSESKATTITTTVTGRNTVYSGASVSCSSVPTP
jgi:prepilin-type N-terminal cleavage/methylation domain-containing protein